ncbi:YqgE/AlgH family protein [Gangjinia marincola]|uniref:YqgE/AlgH family protein n=1 Tax=Gangjinia marincola TaxID=578463 RepID=UPI0031CEE012
MTTLKPEKGRLLIAEPSIIGDPSFNRSVVLLADHSENGSIGFILNKVLDYTLDELLPNINANFNVYNGGPVEQDNLYYIHKIPQLIFNSVEIADGIFWGGNFAEVEKLIAKNEISEHQIKFFLGYSGWQPKQLAEELQGNSWIVAKNDDQVGLIGRSYSSFWKEKMIALGGDYLLWSNAPENPNYN